MAKKLSESMKKAILAALAAGLVTFIILLWVGIGHTDWPLVVGGIVFLAYVFADNFPGIHS